MRQKIRFVVSSHNLRQPTGCFFYFFFVYDGSFAIVNLQNRKIDFVASEDSLPLYAIHMMDRSEKRSISGIAKLPTNAVVAGIDVGGAKKGFHCAIFNLHSGQIDSLYHSTKISNLIELLRAHENTTGQSLGAIAIDAPARASRKAKQTRSAERALSALGYRIFWTPQTASSAASDGSAPTDWMKNGADLFQALAKAFPDAKLLETFPTAATDRVSGGEVLLDLALFHGKAMRKHFPDFIDAAFAALSAKHSVHNTHESLGQDDEIGPVILPIDRMVDHTLVLIVQDDRILLGKKKRGFGEGYYNGFGGKLEPGETPLKAARRELHEEAGIDCTDLSFAGQLNFTFENNTKAIRGYVYRGSTIVGTPHETEEMAPQWFSVNAIPYHQMWADDPLWFPLFLQGQSFQGYFHFDAEGNLSKWRLSS